MHTSYPFYYLYRTTDDTTISRLHDDSAFDREHDLVSQEVNVAVKNAREELRRIDEEQAKLEKQKEQLRVQAKQEAMASIQDAIRELNSLGFSYRLIEDKGTGSTRGPRAGSGTRRTGIRDQVLAAISAASPDGIAPAGIRERLGIEAGDKSGAQAVANALSALKRQSKISDKDGAYITA